MRFLNDILIEAGLIVNGTVQIDSIPAAVTDTDKFMVSDGGVMKSRTGAQVASDIDAMTKAVYDTDGDGIVDDAEKVTVIARNSTGSTIYKGTIVYLSGSTGNRPNMLKAQANTEPTSSKTFGVVVDDVANNADGQVAALGTLHDLDTRSGAPNPFTSDTLVDGDALWLSPATAGYVTRTKPTAPNHAVFIGIVARTSPTNGRIVYRIQNGYELEELHNVSALTPNNNDGIFYNSTTGLWEAKSIATAAGGTIGTVTSVAMTVPTGLQIGGSPITTSGTLALTYASGYAIPTTVKQSNWDDAYTWVANFPTQTGNGGKFLTTDGSALSWATVVTSNIYTADGTLTANRTLTQSTYSLTFAGTTSTRFHSTGNISVGSTVDDGYKLDVNGTARVGSNPNASQLTVNGATTTNGIFSSSDIYLNGASRVIYANGLTFNTANNLGNSTKTLYLFANGLPVADSGIGGLIDLVKLNMAVNNGTQSADSRALVIDFDVTTNLGTLTAIDAVSGLIRLRNLSGSGSRMVVADSSGVLSTQAIPSGGASGSGTTNYLPKWTGTTSLGDSIIQDNGTQIGIGISPSTSYKMYLYGNMYINGWGAESIHWSDYPFTVATANGYYADFQIKSGANVQLRVSGSSWDSTVALRIGSVLKFTNLGYSTTYGQFFSNGNFLFGSGGVDAGYKLDVTGTFRSTLDANINGLTIGKGGGNVATNTMVGNSAGAAITTGGNNSFYGQFAGLNNLTGADNTYIGREAGKNATASGNTLVGSQAGITLSSNGNNTIVGVGAGYSATSGSNSLFGYFSGYDVSTGGSNTIVGFNTGRGITTGQYNTIIGAAVSGLSSSLSNTIILADGQGNQRLYVNNSGQAYLKDGWLNLHNPSGSGYNFVMSSDYSYDPFVQMSWGSGLNPLSPTRNNFLEVGSENYKIIARGSQVLRFHTQATERATIFGNGNFAIGTTTDAGYKLDVNGTSRSQSITSTNQNHLNIYHSSYDNWLAGSLVIGRNSSYGGGVGGRLSIDCTTGTDTSALTVVESGTTQTFYVTKDGSFGYPSQYEQIQYNVKGFNLAFGGAVITKSSTGGFPNQMVLINGDDVIRLNPSGTNYTNRPVIVGNQSSTGHKFQVDGTTYTSGATTLAATSGNVLIGTTTDAGYKLDVAGTLRTTGDVDLATSSANHIIKVGVGGIYSTEIRLGGGTDSVISKPGSQNIINIYTAHGTSVLGGFNYSLRSEKGIIAGSSSDGVASAILQADSTTRGLLPPRMTSAQRAAISTPAVGLVVYQTDGSEGLYENTSTGWRIVNAAGAGSGVTGTGTTNYLSKWTASTALGDSLVYDNGTNVGIGTTTPSDLFTVNNATNSVVKLTVNNVGALGLASSSAGSWVSESRNTNLTFQVNGTDVMRMFGTANVAIGTGADAGYKLDVNGTARIQYNTGLSLALGTSTAPTYWTGYNALYFGFSSSLYAANASNDAGMWVNAVFDGTNFKRVRTGFGGGFGFNNNGEYTLSLFGYAVGAVNITTAQTENVLFAKHGVGLVVNDDGNSTIDFRVEGDTNANLFLTKASTDNIGMGTASPNASALLDVSSTTKGFLPPRMTETQKNAISTPATGLIVYQTDGTAGLYVYTGAAWKSLAIVA